MDKATQRAQVSNSLEPSDVPFVGWSRAAHEFRVKAASLAPKGILPLLIGDPGVGKRCMARAWHDVAGFGEETTIIDLDLNPGDLPPRCIGYTTRRPDRHRSCFRLDEGVTLYAPQGRGGQPPLPGDLMQHFGISLYMPPIHGHREIDLLAHLDYCNKVRFPHSGFHYSGISVPLINRLFFDNDWPSNLRGLSRFLEMVSDLDRREAKATLAQGDVVDLGTLRDHKEIRMFDRPSRRDPETRVVDWTCDAEDVPIGLIPDLAIRIFHWDCRHGPLGHPDSEDPDSELRRVLLPESLCDGTTGLRVHDFLRMTADEYTREFLFLGLNVNDPKRPDRKEWFSTMLDYAGRESHFGATFCSLQAGLVIDLDRVGRMLSVDDLAAQPSGVIGVKPTHPGPVDEPLSASAEFLNRFEFRNGRLFHLEFHADGRHEEDYILRKECIGLAYYELLLRNPGQDLDANLLHASVKSREKEEQSAKLSECEFDSVVAVSTRVESTTSRSPPAKENQNGRIDQETRRVVLDRIDELKVQIKEAQEEGDNGSVCKLTNEEKRLRSYLNEATYKGRIKDKGREEQATIENTRKALENARARIRKTMPGLANHLEKCVTSRAGRWTYRPPADLVFHFWDK